MLAVHLNPQEDAASRRPPVIKRTVDWLVDYLKLKVGDTVLDLGCGPGLYCTSLSQRGLRMVGIDYSRRSIDYALAYARQNKLPIEYRYQDYLTLDIEAEFDVVLLIYGDLCPLSPEKRGLLLGHIHRALKPGGYFVFDVSTRILRARYGLQNGWYVADSGFWKPGPHLVLEQGFDYPEHDTYLDQFVVIEADGRISVYRNWFLDYSPETITPIIEQAGFDVRAMWSDLAGTPYAPGSEWIGIAAQKA
ncbi:MAG: methyltransferase domain-containing protein [Anaerolineae bacterium]|nr:methyltransferase domain-containing protein [Anaerolineae bacterium]